MMDRERKNWLCTSNAPTKTPSNIKMIDEVRRQDSSTSQYAHSVVNDWLGVSVMIALDLRLTHSGQLSDTSPLTVCLI